MTMTDEDRQAMAAAIEQAFNKATPMQSAVQSTAPPLPAAQMAGPGMMVTGQMMPAGQMVGQPPQPTGVSLRLSIPMPDGSEVPAYLHFGAEALANLPAVIQQVAAAWPIKVYPPRQQRWGGWNNNRGGYRRW